MYQASAVRKLRGTTAWAWCRGCEALVGLRQLQGLQCAGCCRGWLLIAKVSTFRQAGCFGMYAQNAQSDPTCCETTPAANVSRSNVAAASWRIVSARQSGWYLRISTAKCWAWARAEHARPGASCKAFCLDSVPCYATAALGPNASPCAQAGRTARGGATSGPKSPLATAAVTTDVRDFAQQAHRRAIAFEQPE